jgi:outer membrane protein
MQKNSFGQRWKLIIVLLAIINTNVNAQTKNEFSVQQCVDYGLKNSIAVKNALLDIQNQEQVNREVIANALPQINGSGSITDFFNTPTQVAPIVFPGATVNSLGYSELNFALKYNSTFGISAQQILFDGQVFVGLQAKQTAIDVYKKAAEVTEEQIKLNIYKVYFQLKTGEQQKRSLDSNIAQFAKLLNDTRVIFANGFVEKLDVDRDSVQLTNLRTDLEKVVNQLDAGYAGLKFLINIPQSDSLVLTDTLNESNLQQDTSSLTEPYQYTDRKEVQLLGLTSRLDSFNIKRYQLSRIPSLALVGSFSKNAYDNNFNTFNSKEVWYPTSYVGVQLNVPVFDGFARRAKIEEAKIAFSKDRNNLEQWEQQVDYEVAISRTNMRSALSTIESQKKNMELAEEVYTTSQKKYEQGIGSNQDLYEAQTEKTTAQNNYYSALYDAIIAKIDYLHAAGKL